MSAASEWATRHEKAEDTCRGIRKLVPERPRFVVPYGGSPEAYIVLGEVDTLGQLRMHSGHLVKPERAIEFANWIIATFGEAQP